MLAGIVFILILSVLVIVHEFGHYITAKKAGVRVEEFGLGLPPRIFGKKIGETIYSINLLPFGGFVKLTGEDFDEEVFQADQRSFANKSPLWRGLILVAGVVMNLVLAVTLYYGLLISNGYKSLTIPMFFDYNFKYGDSEYIHTVVMGVEEDSAAKEAEILLGEAIIEIDGQPVYNVTDVKAALETKAGQEVSVLLMDVRSIGNDVRSITAIPGETEEGRGILGVSLSKAVTLNYERNKLWAGFAHSYNMLAYSASTLGGLVGLSVEMGDIAPVSESISGPVGIFGAVEMLLTFPKKQMVLSLVDLTALFSLSLAMLNILPFPALDGGRIVFVIFEGITRKKVNPKIEAFLHKWGMLLLLALLILITIKDIKNIIG